MISVAHAFVVALECADVLVLETVGGDLLALGHECADPVGVDMCDDRRHRECRSEVMALQHGEQRRQSLIGAELGLRRRQIGGTDAVRPGRDAQIDGDADTVAGPLRPADFVVGEALLVRDRVAFFPRHISRLLGLRPPEAAAGILRGTSAPLPRSSGTTRRAGFSSA